MLLLLQSLNSDGSFVACPFVCFVAAAATPRRSHLHTVPFASPPTLASLTLPLDDSAEIAVDKTATAEVANIFATESIRWLPFTTDSASAIASATPFRIDVSKAVTTTIATSFDSAEQVV